MSRREEKDRSRERKKRGSRKYGQAKLKHSKKGILSCVTFGAVFFLFAVLIVIAYTSGGTVPGYIGAVGLLALAGSFLGLYLARKGLREREKDYLTCKVGLVGNLFFFFIFIAIFCWGLF